MIYFVRNQQDADTILEKLKDVPRFAFDTETDGLNITTLNCSGFSVVTEELGVYFPLIHADSICCPPEVAWPTLQKLVDQAAEVCFHNAAFDIKIAKKYGVEFSDYQIRDSLIAANMLGLTLEGTSKALKPLVESIFDHHAPTLEEITNNVFPTLLPATLVGSYCISDSYWTLKLVDYLEGKLREQGMYRAWAHTECPFALVIAEMEFNGFLIDTNSLRETEESFKPRMKELEEEIFKITGPMSFKSTKDMMSLFTKGIWDRSKAQLTDKGQVSVDKTTLKWFAAHGSELGAKVARDILKWKSLDTICSTFTSSLYDKVSQYTDGRLRCNIEATRTYRLSSNGPNMQNIPARGEGAVIRKAFTVPAGKKQINIDFSQVELRMAGHLSDDKNLLSVYCYGKDAKGNDVSDLHELMLNAINEIMDEKKDRRIAKNVNFGFLNQQSAEAFAIMYDIALSEAEILKETFTKKYSGLTKYYKSCEKKGMEDKYVTLMNGARRFFLGDKSERIQMSNTPIQGNAALCMKHAMLNTLRCFREKGTLNKEIKIIMSVHDEGIYECDADKVNDYLNMIKSCFELVTYTFNLKVPLLSDIKYADTWADSH